MNRRPVRRLVRRGRLSLAAVTAGALALSGCSFGGVDTLPLPGGPDLGDHPYTVKIQFRNVLDLVPQSVVKVNDVSVGKVTKIKLTGWEAEVTVKIRRDVNLPDNAQATIGQTSLLGEKFVELSNPANETPQGKLGSGDLIKVDASRRSTEIEEVLSALSLLLNGGGLEQVSTITRELNAAMSGRTETIKAVLGKVDTFVGTLDQNRASITRALDSLDRLTAKLSAERKTIADTIDQAGPAITILNRNRADLTRMLVSLDKLSKTTTNVITRSKADTLANLKALDVSLRNLNKAGSNLPNSLETMLTFPFPATFANVLKGDYGNVRMTLDLDMKNLLHNLLGGTDLEGLLGKQGAQLRGQLRPPSMTLPQAPPGVLTSAPDLSTGTGTGTPKPGAMGSLQGNPGLYSLMIGGLS